MLSEKKGCYRSHPHEDMDEECQRKTVEARVANLSAQTENQEPVKDDLTEEAEILKAESDSFYMDYQMNRAHRITELGE